MSLRLKAPEPLPADGVTTVAFKAWKNNLLSFLEQDTDNYLFLEGGIYASWSSLDTADSRKRITDLHTTDPDKVKCDRKFARDPDNYTDNELQEDLRVLLLKRNAQLSKLIQLICVACHYTESDDISNVSTSVTWIFSYLEQHYNLEKRGAHFLKVSAIQYKSGANHQTFYREFRAAFQDNLKRTGHKIKYQGDRELTADETLSPTFEETIVLWALEKIDPRLPAHVNKTFGHQMTGHTTLKDLQVQIFQRIPGMIQEMDDAEANRATLNHAHVQPQNQEVDLAAFRPQNYQRDQRANRNFGDRRQYRRSCQVCRIAGRPPAIINSHTQANCRLKNTILNYASVEDPDNEFDIGFDHSQDDQDEAESQSQ